MYHVFCGCKSYPNGGMGDYKGSRPTLEGAYHLIMSLSCDWWQIASTSATGWLILAEDGERS